MRELSTDFSGRSGLNMPRLHVKGVAACLDVTLEKNACLLVDLIPAEDQTPTYHGLDEAFYDNLNVEE
jgi:hypothetical protein